jgi:hypothetical protein
MTIKLELHRIFQNGQKFDFPLFMLPIQNIISFKLEIKVS